MSNTRLSREERFALLAVATGEELIEVADACLGDGVDPVLLVAPEVGCVSTQVREPILRERFLLGDALACHVEVEVNGVRGWAMRLDDDRPAVLAMAILDAVGEADGVGARRVDDLCERVAERLRRQDAEEWAELAPTIVEFEEL